MGAIIATAPVPPHARLDTADTRDLALPTLGQQATAETTAYEHGRVFGCTMADDARDLARVSASFLAGALAEDAWDLGLRVALLLADPATPAAHAAEIRDSVTRWRDEIADAEKLLSGAKLIAEYASPAGDQHPAWETDCIDGDTPLHVSEELTVTIPSTRDTTTTLSVQVQQNDGEVADLWLDGRTVSADDAEAHALHILAAAALARRINAERAA